ncbi:hypothetical protein LG632_20100, partial [Streptomyces sp. SMC 277]|nr:hypothetical protein [Streptomyces antimicrobicus]
MTTALFIHGTGVREPAFSGLYARFTAGLHAVAPAVRPVPFYWGGEFGARLAAGGLSLPQQGGRSRGGLGASPGALGVPGGPGGPGGPDGAGGPGGAGAADDDADSERWADLYR